MSLQSLRQMRAIVRRVVSLSMIIALSLISAYAAAEWPATPQDYAHLPGYCRARLKPNDIPKATRDRWEQRVGPDFLHVHHYCAALHSLRLASGARSEEDRNRFLRAAVAEIAYVEDKAKPNWFLRAEIEVQKGRALLRLNEIPRAIQAFHSSLKVNPRFPAAYAGIADAYLMLKQPEKAKATLDKGIKAIPNAKGLRTRRASIK